MLSNLWEIKEREKIIAIDIDGVLLSSYPQCWIDFVNNELKTNFDDLNIMKNTVSYEQYRKLKEKYRLCGIKENLLPDKDAKIVTEYLKKEGYTIVIITARPANKYITLYNQTIKWLDKNGIIYDYIYFGNKDKHATILSELTHIRYIIEDNSYVANSIAKWGYNVFLLTNKYNKDIKLEKNVIRINSLSDVIKEIGVGVR